MVRVVVDRHKRAVLETLLLVYRQVQIAHNYILPKCEKLLRYQSEFFNTSHFTTRICFAHWAKNGIFISSKYKKDSCGILHPFELFTDAPFFKKKRTESTKMSMNRPVCQSRKNNNYVPPVKASIAQKGIFCDLTNLSAICR